MMGEVRAGIYPQASSHLLSRLAPQDDSSPALLGCVTHPFGDPEGVRSRAFWGAAFLRVQEWRGTQGIPAPTICGASRCTSGAASALTLFVAPGPGGGLGRQNCKFPEAVLEPGPPGETV